MLDHTTTAVRLRLWAAVLGIALMPLAPTPELRAQAHGHEHPSGACGHGCNEGAG